MKPLQSLNTGLNPESLICPCIIANMYRCKHAKDLRGWTRLDLVSFVIGLGKSDTCTDGEAGLIGS